MSTHQMGLPFQKHSETSRAAAISMLETAPSQRARVFRFLRDYGPATDEEIISRLGLSSSAGRPRRIELVAMGVVQDSGLRSLTRSGRKAVLWETVT